LAFVASIVPEDADAGLTCTSEKKIVLHGVCVDRRGVVADTVIGACGATRPIGDDAVFPCRQAFAPRVVRRGDDASTHQ